MRMEASRDLFIVPDAGTPRSARKQQRHSRQGWHRRHRPFFKSERALPAQDWSLPKMDAKEWSMKVPELLTWLGS